MGKRRSFRSSPAMSARSLAPLFASQRPLLRAGLFGLGVALAAAGPASAGGRVIDCALGSKESPERLIAACSTIADNTAASKVERSAALVVRGDAQARNGGLTEALADL